MYLVNFNSVYNLTYFQKKIIMIYIHILYFILFLYTGVEVPFPSGLTGYGLNEEILSSIFQDDWDGPLQSSLKGIPNVEFYQLLHPF